MTVKFDRFEWDEGNLQKCQKHGVSIIQIQELLLSKASLITIDKKHSEFEERHIAIGVSRGRLIFVAFTLRRSHQETLLRPISARFMHSKEIRKYEKKTTKI